MAECPDKGCFQRGQDAHDVVFGKDGNSGLKKSVEELKRTKIG